MVTKQQITDDFTSAFKVKDEIKKRTLGAIKAEILVYEKSGSDKEVTEEVLQGILKSMAKKRRESIEAYEQAGREELAQHEREELKIIESYLPAQLDEAAIRAELQKLIDEQKLTKADFGRAMGAAMGRLKGQTDGNVVSGILKELLP